MPETDSPWFRSGVAVTTDFQGDIATQDRTQENPWPLVVVAAESFDTKSAASDLGEQSQEQDMAEQTREEVDAKLAAVEARLDAKLSGVAADIRIVSTTLDQMNASLNEVRADMREARTEVGRENKSTRTTMIVTGIAVAVAIIAAVWQMQGGLLAAFQIGLSAAGMTPGT